MNKFTAILYDTLLEIRSGKMLYIYGVVTFFMVVIIALVPSIQIGGEQIFESGMFADSLISGASSIFFDKFLGFIVFLMYLGTAWLIPSFLKKGRIELTLSKPISRFSLLSMKFIAVYLIMITLLAIIALIIWLMLSIRLESFSVNLFAGLISAFTEYLVIFTIIFALGVITRSGAFSLMGYFVLKIVAGLLVSREIAYNFIGDSVWKTIIDTLYHILPKFSEMSDSFTALVEGTARVDYYPIYSTLAFTAALYLITLLVFQKRDY
jgi:ABC-type transport system involved in multi-copper enzyme maturation permease subunit